MTRAVMLAAAFGLSTLVLTPAIAQEITAAERVACKVDYEQFCRGTIPGGGRILRCLEKQYAQLSNACKKVVDGYKK
jgi:pyruvate carboxylase